MAFLRTVAILITLAVIAVATVPLLVVADLIGGGDGWGLCVDGLGSCRTSYFSGLELAAILAAILFVLAALLRFVHRLQRLTTLREERRVSGPASPLRPPARRLPPG